ncbi:uncharacterized protein LOC130929548 isoform X3 [Corythoichthys intestinalis]|uniref:uncharacterized protein LOC130929548 isoform X3 n=1 Tax=Corythoichthys intestinalis TaxID=161448 RepID=UPI0025A5EFEC|nr:uncharacterized protein LOC130929548 isoform X3 [Corythoichthys intestinalis]
MEEEKVAGGFQTDSASRLPLGSVLPQSSPESWGKSESEVKPNEKGQAIVASCQSGPLSSSDEEETEEVEVKVKLEIHTPPAHLHEDEDSKMETYSLSDIPPPNLNKYNPVTPPPPPVLSCSIVPPSPQTPPPTLPPRHWAPPKGFWRVARPETLLLNGMDPHNTAIALPCKDYTQGEEKTAGSGGFVRNVADEASSELSHPCTEDEHDGLSTSLKGKGLSFDERVKVRQNADVKLKERQPDCKEAQFRDAEYGDAVDRVDYEDQGAQGGLEDSVILQDLEPYLRSLLVISDELPLSPRHEQAKRLLERARLKARSNHVKGDHQSRRSHSDQRATFGKQQVEADNPALVQKVAQDKEDLTVQSSTGPLLVPDQAVTSPGEQIVNPEDTRGRTVPCWVSPTKPEVSTRPKAPLTVKFAGAFVLGENKESSTSWKSSGFGKLRRRSRKGESRVESGNGPYGPSWAQRRNSNPRSRVNLSRAVSFSPDSPVTLEPRMVGASSGMREAPTLPIKSALKSSSRNRAGQSAMQYQVVPNQGGDVGPQHFGLLDCPDARRESPASVVQGASAISNPAASIRPSTLRYSPARLNPDNPAAEVWDAPLNGAVIADTSAGPEFHPAMRNLALPRAEDLRAELLRAEHLKAEAVWEDNTDGARKLDARPKLFLRRFFSSIGLNSVGRLVKGGRSSSMEQLSIPATRSNTTSPSPTRRPHPTIRIQRTPSLQTLHTALPLAQLRKASSVQSLERRTERTTILGEVQIPYGLAPSPDSPHLELHRTLSVEDILPSRVVRPAGRVSQAFPDGSLLLELIRPPNGPFGFVISRGKGRPDTGVYVEKVGDGTGEVPYVGLLGVGDEIVQVNGEVVAGLSLDQVTRLMTRESVACLRIVPARRSPR